MHGGVHHLGLSRIWGSGLVALASLACGSPDEPPKLVSEVVPGLVVRGAARFDRDDHLVELVALDGFVYAANSNLGVGAMRLDADGGLTVTSTVSEVYGESRCTTLAVHAPSRSLYCAAETPSPLGEGIPEVERFDLSDPGSPTSTARYPVEHWAVRDLEVVGDVLMIHQFDDGLWVADIGADGALSEPARVELDGNARTSAVVGARVVTAFAEPEGSGTRLRLLDPGDGWSVIAELALDGPPLGISADAAGRSRVAVGLGSGGMAIVEVGADALSVAQVLTPPAVVTHGVVDTEGGIAVAVTLSGAFVWDLEPEAVSESGDDGAAGEPRLFGFAPEGSQGPERSGSMLHGLLVDGELLTSDWTWLERWTLDRSGEVVDLDVPRGLHVAPGRPARWRLRNPGPVELRAEFWSAREHAFDVEIEPHATVDVELPEALRAELGPELPALYLGIRVFDPSVDSAGEPLSTSRLMILERPADQPLPPVVGDSYPSVSFADREQAVFSLPLDTPTFAIWFTPDCAVMWPELEDIAWLERGSGLGRGRPIILTQTDLALDGFDQRFAVDNLGLGLWGPQAPPEVDAANAGFLPELILSFWVSELPGDAVVLDTALDESGRVRSIERMYRGPWTLAADGTDTP